MSFIDSTYFVRSLDLGLSGKNTELAEIQSNINYYENEYLVKTLGQSLADALIASPTDARFVDLLNGKEYTVNGTTKKWQGLVNTTMKTSPIANYVYYCIVKDRAERMSVVGNVVNDTENSTRVNPGDKMVQAWRGMAEWNIQMYDYIIANANVYPEYEYHMFKGFSYGFYYSSNCNPMYSRSGGGNRIGI
jgi:hypothetical protein